MLHICLFARDVSVTIRCGIEIESLEKRGHPNKLFLEKLALNKREYPRNSIERGSSAKDVSI